MQQENKKQLKDLVCLVYDPGGIYTELAAALVKSYKKVLYFVPWVAAFPDSKKQKIGLDFKGLTRIQDFFAHVDESDLIVCFDTYSGDLMAFLNKIGKPVWSPMGVELMELDRWKMRKMQMAVGLPTQPTLMLQSIDDLELYFEGINNRIKDDFGTVDKDIATKMLKNIWKKYNQFNEDYYIAGDKKKLIKEWLEGAQNKFIKSNMRGDIETFFAPNYNDSLSKFNHLFNEFGHRTDGKDIQFTIEDKIDGVEPGGDHIEINGKFLSPTMWGIERKGDGYIGRIGDYSESPKVMRDMNEKLIPIIKKLSPSATFFSSEFLLDKKGDAYLIDPTPRCPAPVGSAIMCELIENLGEVIWEGANSRICDPVMKYKYAAGVCMTSEWAQDHELEVEVPKEIDQFVKFRTAYFREGKYYTVPGFDSVCSVIAFGDTIDEVITTVEKRLGMVKGYCLNGGADGLKKIVSELKEFKDAGFDM